MSTATQSFSSFTNASQFGFSPGASGTKNTKALQRAVDQGGTVVVSEPGTYPVAGTVYIGSNTSLLFGNGVFLKKVDEHGDFTHVILNKGALTKTYDYNITVEGLHIMVNGMDKAMTEVFGLRGQIAFFYVKDLRLCGFRCLDLESAQFAVHICTFEDILVDDVIIKGKKDGVHLGRGRRFTISNGVFQTVDDAVALNAHDYSTSNPELGWIEDGVVQNCYDLPNEDPEERNIGYFCRMLGGGWIDWRPGMEVQQSDSVIANGRVYRVQVQPDGKVYTSLTAPSHTSGSEVVDGITWGVVQEDITYAAGVRNVVFRDIFLQKPRISFSIHFDNDRFSRSYYPGAEVPMQEQILFDNVRVMNDGGRDFINVATPVDVMTIANSSLGNNKIAFRSNKAMSDYLKTRINMLACVFTHPGVTRLLENSVSGKNIVLKTAASIALRDDFQMEVSAGEGTIDLQSDLPTTMV